MDGTRIISTFGWLLIFGAFPLASALAQVPKIADVPDTLVGQIYQNLEEEHVSLLHSKETLAAKVQQHNAKCGSVEEGTQLASECAREQTALESERQDYAAAVTKFNQEVVAALKSQGSNFSERAAKIVTTLNAVSAELKLPKGPVVDREKATLNCKDFFLHVGDHLVHDGDESWRDEFKETDSANDIVRKIDLASKGGKKWEKLEGNGPNVWKKAQELANQGAIVVGGMPADENSNHGHLGFVFPTPVELHADAFSGTGPFVRDGNEHQPLPDGRVYPSTYGAVRASKAFVLSETSWYIWAPSK